MAKTKKTPEEAENSGGGDQPQQPESAEQPKEAQQVQTNEEISKDARQWGMFCHPAGLLINIVSPSNMRKNQPKWKGTGNVILC